MSQFGFLAEIADALEVAGVTYMVTGSIASTHHATPRMTRNIDIVIEPDISAVEILVEQFDPTRFYVGDALRAVADRDMFNVIDTTGGWKVDLIVRKARPFSEVGLGPVGPGVGRGRPPPAGSRTRRVAHASAAGTMAAQLGARRSGRFCDSMG